MPPSKKAAPAAPKTLDDVLALVQAEHGSESLMLLGKTPMAPVEVIPTGSFALDEALGTGGLPRGRIIEVYGPESTGKTSVALHAVANAQRMGLNAAFIDAEHAFSEEWAGKLGVSTGNLLVSQPDNGEQALDIAETLCETGLIGIIVIDSVAALVPRAEIEGMMGDSHMGLHARLMSQALRKLTGVVSESKTTVVFINQLREKVGVFFGNPETTTGGKALKFYASIRLDVRRGETIKEGSVAVGHKLRITVVKNKLAPPFKQAIVSFLYSGGISALDELVEVAAVRGVLKKTGTWYVYNGENLGNGTLATRKRLEADGALRTEIEDKTRQASGTVVDVPKTTALDLSAPNPWDNADV